MVVLLRLLETWSQASLRSIQVTYFSRFPTEELLGAFSEPRPKLKFDTCCANSLVRKCVRLQLAVRRALLQGLCLSLYLFRYWIPSVVISIPRADVGDLFRC